ncbi:MAG: hypothetical protein AAB282_01320, partial [Nitrospirota bacterium]
MNRLLTLAVCALVFAVGAALPPPPATKVEPEDALLEALLLIDEKYVTKPQVPQYRGMAGQGLLRIA